jgi:hypothetical protein
MVMLAALFDTEVTLTVAQLGAEALVEPSELSYQLTVPGVPSLTLLVVAAKLALPMAPAVTVPDWTPRMTVGAEQIVKTATEEETEPSLSLK